MSEHRFVLVDFTYMDRVGVLRLYEAGRTYKLSQAIAHAATKRELVANSDQRAGYRLVCSSFQGG
jgi:hypothetical protein